ncbi:MAG: sulfide-dependent adenosine diphosphate thiazole synthase [bacterium]
MPRFEDTEISKAIMSVYHEKLLDGIISDVIAVGAGPASMTAAIHLARKGLKVAVLERRLAPGGGVWGGGMAMSEVVVQEEVLPILDDIGVRHKPWGNNLHTADSVELASALCVKTIQSGAALLNLLTVEDVSVHGNRVTGVVVNRTMISGALHVDPITFSAKAVIDGTGHDASVVEFLRKHGLLDDSSLPKRLCEGPMDAFSGEEFVVENVAEVYPGLWVTGMSVCAVLGGPRMGPIFGGMLLSGKRVAELIHASLTKSG